MKTRNEGKKAIGVELFLISIAAEDDNSAVETQLYNWMFGLLLYLAIRTRLYILKHVLILARFHSSQTTYCHRTVKHLRSYLRGNTNHGIKYVVWGTSISALVDFDYAADHVYCKYMPW